MMIRVFCRFMATFVLVSFNAFVDIRGNDDGKELIGKWEYVSMTYEGKPFDVGKNANVTITKDSWTIRRNEKIIRSTWKIDSTKSPKHLTRVINSNVS